MCFKISHICNVDLHLHCIRWLNVCQKKETFNYELSYISILHVGGFNFWRVALLKFITAVFSLSIHITDRLQCCQLCLNFKFLFWYIVLLNAWRRTFCFIVGTNPAFVKYTVTCIFLKFHLIKKNYIDRLQILLNWFPDLWKQTS